MQIKQVASEFVRMLRLDPVLSQNSSRKVLQVERDDHAGTDTGITFYECGSFIGSDWHPSNIV